MITVDSIAFKQNHRDLTFNTVEYHDSKDEYGYEHRDVVPRGTVLLVHKRDDNVVVHCDDKLYTCKMDNINPTVANLLTEQGATGRTLLGMLRAE